MPLTSASVCRVKTQLQRSRTEIKNVENVVSDVENKTLLCRDRYRSIMTALKKDVRKTEMEMKTLQDHASKLSLRREELMNEILKQVQDYQRLIDNFAKDFEKGNKKIMFSNADLENAKYNCSNDLHM